MEEIFFYLKQGLFHVLDWSAYDHILFLVVLVVVFTFADWKKALWLITLFTIGHTITLALAAYNLIYIKSSIVEFLIAATIFVTALSNMLSQKKGKSDSLNLNLFFALFFGLVHGLGFSSYFKILVGDEEGKILPLFSFAIGVELAQIAMVIALLISTFFGLTIFKFSKRDWVLVISAIVFGIAIPILYSRKFW